jgi:predicted nucleic acid-binding protein
VTVAFPVFFDACTLFGITLSDVVLRLADAGAFRPLWSETVLEEIRRNAVLRGFDAVGIDRRLDTMRQYFPDAMVDGYEDLVHAMTCDEKDRHVLAAAARAGADSIVTFNTRDFPPASVAPFAVDVVHPDDFLLDQLDLFPSTVCAVLRELSEDYVAPPMTVADVLETLERAGTPRFAATAARLTDG